jgi:hypothetical protein
MIKPNRIVCAAVKGPLGHQILGVRHFDELMIAQMNLYPTQEWHNGIEGFIDKNGTFQSRKHALAIAQNANQCIYAVGSYDSPTELFSEHLY